MNLIRYYMRNRIFIIIDLTLISVPVLALFIGWHLIVTTLSQPITIFGLLVGAVLVCYGLVSLGDRRYINHAKKHIELEVFRRQQAQPYVLPYPTDDADTEEIVAPDMPVLGNGETASEANPPQIEKMGTHKMG